MAPHNRKDPATPVTTPAPSSENSGTDTDTDTDTDVTRERFDTWLSKHPARPYTKRTKGRKFFPYLVRGRVELAAFNCPRCNTAIRFRARTAFKQRCPVCALVMYIRLLIGVAASQGGRVGRPPDTIIEGAVVAKPYRGSPAAHLPEMVADDSNAEFVAELKSGQRPQVDPMPKVEVREWKRDDPYNLLEVIDDPDSWDVGGEE